MATSGGPNIINDGLVFGYDTGYPAADNTQALRFNNGEPTTNLVTNPDFSTGDMTGWSSTDTSHTQVDIREVSIENGYYYFHKKCTSTGAGSHDRLYQSSTYTLDTSLTTTVTIDIWINPQNAYSISFYGLGSTADDTTYNEKPLSSNSSDVTTIDLGGGWTRYIYTLQTAWYTGSGTSFRVAVYPGWSGTGLMEYKVKSLQVEQKGHATPFVNGTRSSTGALIDLKETTDIDVDDISFNSDGQPVWDGTDDKIVIPADSFSNIGTEDFTVEVVFKNTKTSNYSHFFSVKDQYHFALKMENTGNRNIYVYRDSGLSTYSAISAYAPSSTDYYHLVCKREGDNLELYLNGVSKGTKSGWNSIDIENDSYATSIGTHGASSEFTGGEIPVVRLYTRVLSAQEVKQNYNAYRKRFGL